MLILNQKLKLSENNSVRRNQYKKEPDPARRERMISCARFCLKIITGIALTGAMSFFLSFAMIILPIWIISGRKAYQ